MLVRLQLPLFGQERESNILSVEGGKGGSKNAAASRMRESIKKRRFDQEGSTTDGDVGFRWASLPERCRPVDSSPPLCLYLWVTWLLRRPGNVCSDSVLNEPPGRDRPSELTPTHFVPASQHFHSPPPESFTLQRALDNE